MQPRQMNAGLQAYLLKKAIERAGVDADKIDVEALMDASLSMPENREMLLRSTGLATSTYQDPAFGQYLETEDAQEEYWSRVEHRIEREGLDGPVAATQPPSPQPPETPMNTQPSQDVAQNARRAMMHDPTLREALTRALAHEDDPQDDFERQYGWKASEVPIAGHHVKALKDRALVRVGYESRKHTHYIFTDKEAIRLALAQPELAPAPVGHVAPELEAEFVAVAAKDPVATLLPMVAPHIHGLERAKKALLLCLASADDSGNSRGRIHCLYHGPPGTAKSEILLWAQTVTGCEVFSSRMTGPGLTVDMRTGEPGALPRAHNTAWRVVGVDEVEKVSPAAIRQTLQALEEGQFTYVSANGSATLEAAVRFIGAANEIDGLPPEFRDRMDFLVHVPLPDREAAKSIVGSLTDHFMLDGGEARHAFIQAYLGWARNHKPRFPLAEREAAKRLICMFLDIQSEATVRIRPIESLYRIAYALARLRHSDVSAALVLEAIQLQNPDLNGGKLAALRQVV